jgi:hypothetical protein
LQQFIVIIVREINPIAHTGHQVQVSVEHFRHQVAISSQADHKVLVLSVVHEFHYGVNEEEYSVSSEHDDDDECGEREMNGPVSANSQCHSDGHKRAMATVSTYLTFQSLRNRNHDYPLCTNRKPRQ